mmetsp:Transcript_29296/g.73544  ORF Transcript_29296/g.73544 Transcript_29296/m.73544 type:complete len:218 (+) Transcript_29296:47-700(+)
MRHQSEPWPSCGGARLPSNSPHVRFVVAPDLMLDAATIRQLNDGARSATGHRPCDHHCMSDAAPGQGFAEDAGRAIEEGRLAMAREAARMPASPATHPVLEPSLEACAVGVVVKEVDVEDLLRAVSLRVGHEGTAWTAATGASLVHPLVVVADVPQVDDLGAGTTAPHLVPALSPTVPPADLRFQFFGHLVVRDWLRAHAGQDLVCRIVGLGGCTLL